MAQRRGRRPGKQDTRDSILAAARQLFAEQGYDNATVRQIGAAAGVDPALVHHYFGSKEQLFLATVQPPVNPAEVIPRLIAGDIDQLGERVVQTFLSMWESPVTGPMFEAMFRGAFVNGISGRLVREFFAAQILRRVVKELAGTINPGEIPLRANFAASQLFGLVAIRYILKFEPLASATHEQVIAAVAPTIQRYLTGDLTVADPDS